MLKQAKKIFRQPIVVIGGINNLNYKKLINLGLNILQYQVIFGITQF